MCYCVPCHVPHCTAPSASRHAKLAPAAALEPVTSAVVPGQHRHSCTDEQQASSDTSGKWGGWQWGGQQQGWHPGAWLSLTLFPSPAPATVPGGLCPLSWVLHLGQLLLTHMPVVPQPLCPPLFLSEFQGSAQPFFTQDIFRPIDVTAAPALPGPPGQRGQTGTAAPWGPLLAPSQAWHCRVAELLGAAGPSTGRGSTALHGRTNGDGG